MNNPVQEISFRTYFFPNIRYMLSLELTKDFALNKKSIWKEFNSNRITTEECIKFKPDFQRGVYYWTLDWPTHSSGIRWELWASTQSELVNSKSTQSRLVSTSRQVRFQFIPCTSRHRLGRRRHQMKTKHMSERKRQVFVIDWYTVGVSTRVR